MIVTNVVGIKRKSFKFGPSDPPLRREGNLQPCDGNGSWGNGVVGRQKISEVRKLWPVTVRAVERRQVALDGGTVVATGKAEIAEQFF